MKEVRFVRVGEYGEKEIEIVSISNVAKHLRKLGELWFGREGKAFRICEDSNRFGLKAKGIGIFAGETIYPSSLIPVKK